LFNADSFPFSHPHRERETGKIDDNIGILLRSYTHALNLNTGRHGSLFQPHTKAKLVTDESYLLTLICYIHQNPLRAKLVKHCEDWEYSSYLDLIGKRKGSLPDKHLLKQYFSTEAAFEIYSQEMVPSIREEYWV
jgi:putative transposase